MIKRTIILGMLLGVSLIANAADNAIKTIDKTENCKASGTRTIKGTYDSDSGALALTVSFNQCKVDSATQASAANRKGVRRVSAALQSTTVDGTSSIDGNVTSFIAFTGTELITRLTLNSDQTVSVASGTTINQYNRTCSSQYDGGFNMVLKQYQGSYAQNCQNTGSFTLENADGELYSILLSVLGG